MKNKLRIAGLIATCVALVAVLAGCSEPDNLTWPKRAVGSSQTIIRVAVPTSNPWEADNATDKLVNAVFGDMVAQWYGHQDIKLEMVVDQGCPAQTVANCFEVWRVPETVVNPIAPGTPPPCWPNCAFALRWGNSQHYLNANAGQPTAVVYPENWEIDGEVLTTLQWRNMICHEGGHMLSLDHWDSDDDGVPDATGPCVDAVPDRDTDPSDGTAPGYDWSAVDIAYDRCVYTTASYAPGGGAALDPTEANVDAAPDCGSSLAARSAEPEGDGPVVADVVADPAEHFEGG